MDNTKINKVDVDVLDIRQSENWADYLQFYGWKSFRTKSGINVQIKKNKLVGIAKIQRPKPLIQKDLDEIDSICKKNKALLTKIEPGQSQDITVLEKSGYAKNNMPLIPPSTIFINLKKTKDQLWNSFSRSAKYSVKRAQREKTKIEIYANPNATHLKKFYTLHKQTGKDKKFMVQSFGDLEKKLECFKNECFIIFSYTNEGELCGANLYLGFNKNVWYIHGGTTKRGRKARAGHELFWKSFLYFKEHGYNYLDLEGTDDDRFYNMTKDWGGFSHFKEKFGGITVRFPYPYIKFNNRLGKAFFGIIPIQI